MLGKKVFKKLYSSEDCVVYNFIYGIVLRSFILELEDRF